MHTMTPPRRIRREAPEEGGGGRPSAGADLPVSMVDRVSLVLRAFSTEGPMTLAQVTAHTGLPRSSVHRLLEQLTAAGWLARAPEQTYELGVNAYEMGQAAFRNNRLLRVATPLMQAFAQRTGYTIQLGVVDRGDTVYLAKVNGRRSGPTPTAVAQRVPAHLTALGKAIMARADEAGPRAATPFERELEEIRARGAAFDRGEAFPGIGCVGVSLGPDGHPYANLAGFSVCAPLGTFDHRQFVAPLRIAAGEIWNRCTIADLEGR